MSFYHGSPDGGWSRPLFDLTHLRYYCFNLLCPWTAIYEILERQMHVNPSDDDECSLCALHNGNRALTWPELLQSCCTTWLPCCLVSNELVRCCANRTGHDDEDDQSPFSLSWSLLFGQGTPEHHTPLSWSETAHAALPVVPLLSMSSPDHPPEEAAVGGIVRGMQCAALQALCLGCVCLVPTTFYLRRQVDRDLHYATEPVWRTGLIACCAWPCALSQIIDEMNECESSL